MSVFGKTALVTLAALVGGWTTRLTASGSLDLSGHAAIEVRAFASRALHAVQENEPQISLTFEPEIRMNSDDRANQFVLKPFIRLDSLDNDRTHLDLREAYWRHKRGEWQLLAGVNRVFWGVAESRHLVDIINQTDGVEDIDDEAKLGQPMIQLGKQNDWGELQLFILPYFRERTFPGVNGRLRPPMPVNARATYEFGAGRWHNDVALRYAHYFGDWDVGASYFHGIGREPMLRASGSGSLLTPHYTLIHQAGFDIQFTREAWLWKFEGIVREGHGATFGAAVGGGEYTFYQLQQTAVDLGLVVEYHMDGRDDTAPPTLYDSDLFLGTRLALNDTQDTSILFGTLVDTNNASTLAFLEAERRLGNFWKIQIAARILINIDSSDPSFALRHDDFVNFSLQRHF